MELTNGCSFDEAAQADCPPVSCGMGHRVPGAQLRAAGRIHVLADVAIGLDQHE